MMFEGGVVVLKQGVGRGGTMAGSWIRCDTGGRGGAIRGRGEAGSGNGSYIRCDEQALLSLKI